jgi:hypothetical protein
MARQWALWAYEAGLAQGIADANEWARAVAPLVPVVETQETGSIAYDAPCDCHDCAAGQEHDPDGASCVGQ